MDQFGELLDPEGDIRVVEYFDKLNLNGWPNLHLLKSLNDSVEIMPEARMQSLKARAARASRVMAERLQRQQSSVSNPWHKSRAAKSNVYAASLSELVQQDLANMRAGVYRPPYNTDVRQQSLSGATALDQVSQMLNAVESAQNVSDPRKDLLYRQVLVPLASFMADKNQIEEETKLLEVGCGTGRLHTFIKDNYPTMHTTASERSAYKLYEANESMEAFIHAQKIMDGRTVLPPRFRVASAEDLPFEHEEFNVVVNTFLFHALPVELQELCAEQYYRVLKPGGQMIFMDYIQEHDRDTSEFTLASAQAGTEASDPLYQDYLQSSVEKIFTGQGFKFESCRVALDAKILSFRKPDVHGAPVPLSGLPALTASLPRVRVPSGKGPSSPSGPTPTM